MVPTEFDELLEKTNNFVQKALAEKDIPEDKLRHTVDLIERSINDYCRISDSLRAQSKKWNESAERFMELRDTLKVLIEYQKKERI